MELTTVTSRTILPHTGQHENIPLILVGKLLATILSGTEEEILVEGNSQKFVYNADTGIQIGKMLKATVLEVKTQQKESTIEISLNGTVETAAGFQETCNLYFYMWWDHTQKSPLENHCVQRLKPLSLLIHPTTLSERLSDSVFELDLYRRKGFQQQQYLGQGRGYLVFGRTN